MVDTRSQESFSSKTQLHIFLGAGGVGKTTLSAGFAVALARSGRKVGLMSIDPARRLKTALGVASLGDAGQPIDVGPGAHPNGSLLASLLIVDQAMERWVQEAGIQGEARQKLFRSSLFKAVSEKLASASDNLAAARVSEWLEQFPDLDDLVIDTAPGIHAVDFLVKPEKILLFLDSKLIDWLRWFVGDDGVKQTLWNRVVRSGAKKVLDGLSEVGGRSFLINLGEFLVSLDQVFLKLVTRLERARTWFRSPSAHIYIVTAVRDDSLKVAVELVAALQNSSSKTASHAHALLKNLEYAVVNRALPQDVMNDSDLMAALEGSGLPSVLHTPEPHTPPLRPLLNFLQSYMSTQQRICEQLEDLARHVIQIPLLPHLDDQKDGLRMRDLGNLGQTLLSQIPSFKSPGSTGVTL